MGFSNATLPVRGNALRGREPNSDTLNIWTVDDCNATLISNQCLHGSSSALCGDSLGKKFWQGPVVAVLRVGSGLDPPALKDMTMTAYRDAIDFLGYYRDGIGSMVDGIGMGDDLSRLTLADKGRKVRGVLVDCPADQKERREPELVSVYVPKTHPLFNIERDNPLEIPYLYGLSWVTKTSSAEPSPQDEGVHDDRTSLESPSARLLRPRTNIKNGRWESFSDGVLSKPTGSVLVVNQCGYDLKVEDVQDMVLKIKEFAPLMTKEWAQVPNGREAVLDAIRTSADFWKMIRGKSRFDGGIGWNWATKSSAGGPGNNRRLRR
ncbi:hypothetical protein OQA88_13077 [Cercophora sp. LCS_1]